MPIPSSAKTCSTSQALAPRRWNTCRGVCGHYTQIVWHNTRAVGCAVARDAGREVWIYNYDPPGNWIGERPY